MGRAPCCEKVGLKRGRWTAEEDEILTAYIQANGEGSWRSLPKNAGLLRCGKSCRLRWVNYLKSDLKRGKFSSEEDETIIKLHSSLGNRWCLIASHLPGRTDNEIKNYWNSHLSRQLYNFRKIIHQFKQVVVDQPAAKSEKQQLGRRSRSMMKMNKSHVPTKVQLDPPPQTAELNISTTTLSEEGDNGGGSSTSVIMPGTPALEEHVVMSSTLINEDRKTKDDIVLGSFFDDMISDGLEVNPNWDYADFQGDHEMLFTNDEVENWLIDVNNNTGEAKVDQSLLTDAKSTCDQQDHCSSTNMYSYNNVFDNLGWEWDNLDLIDDDEGHKTWDNEEEKMVSWLWETSSDCDKTESVADSYDKQDAFVEWLLS